MKLHALKKAKASSEVPAAAAAAAVLQRPLLHKKLLATQCMVELDSDRSGNFDIITGDVQQCEHDVEALRNGVQRVPGPQNIGAKVEHFYYNDSPELASKIISNVLNIPTVGVQSRNAFGCCFGMLCFDNVVGVTTCMPASHSHTFIPFRMLSQD